MVCWRLYVTGLAAYGIINVTFLLWTHKTVLQRNLSLKLSIDMNTKTPIDNDSSIYVTNPSNTLSSVLHDQLKNKMDPVPVVIVTYMRSGSSLTGDILQQEPNSFYYFEPFRTLQKAVLAKKPLILSDGTNRTVNPEDFIKTAMVIFRDLVACEISRLPRTLLMDSFLNLGIKSRQHSNCMTKLKFLPDDDRFRLCNSVMKSDCNESKFRIFKTIRLPLAFFETFLKEFSSLKIIHLVRDPRATLRSQFLTAMFQMSNISNAAMNLCTRMMEDNSIFQKIQTTHPRSVMRLYYEQLADKPLELSQELYTFLGMGYSEQIQEYILNITSRGMPNRCLTCSQMSDSKDHISAWRTQMSIETVKKIDMECQSVYKQFKYLPIPTDKALKNMNFPTFKWFSV